MGVYKYDAINDELIPIAGVPSVQGLEDKLNTYASDSTQWDVTPTDASNKPVTSSGISAALSGKAPITHTSSTPDTYGAGTTSLYGHNKIVDGLTKTSVSSGESLSAHMGNCIGNMIAPVQANLIAIQKYEIGEQFIYDGVLYTATALISKDDPITINGNCSKASDIVSQISNFTKDVTFKPYVDISGYTSTKYKVLTDGYVYWMNNTGLSRIYITDSSNNGFSVDANQFTNGIFVKKGLELQLGNLSGALNIARFYPIA